MGSSSKKSKDKECRKRKSYDEAYESHRDKKHKHKKHHHHHKEKRREKSRKQRDYATDDSDVIEIVDPVPLSPPQPPRKERTPEFRQDRVPESRNERVLDSRQERLPDPRHDKYLESRQDRSLESRQDRYPESRQDRYPDTRQDRSLDPREERYPDSRADRSLESRHDRGYDSRHEKGLEPRQERAHESSGQRQERAQESSGQSVESLSIEETNKLRAKLGLKPLDVGSTSVQSSNSGTKKKDDGKKKDDLGEFYHKPAENLQQKAQQEKIRAKLQEIREKRQLHSKYSKVKSLGDGDLDGDIESWVLKSRQIDEAKREAEKRAKMLEELDAQFGVSEVMEAEHRDKMRQKYTDRDLRGLTVQHDVDSFAEEQTVILTLKDKGVLEDDDDVLVNVNMLDDERYRKSVENKKKKILYNAYEDNEFDEFGYPKEKSLLSKYDEEIDGVKTDTFRIGFDNAVERKQAMAQSVKEKLSKKKLESIADKQLTLASEYYNEEEMAKFKKPKKKIRKIRTKGKLLTADELQEQPKNTGIEAIGQRRPKYKNDPDFDIDDVPTIAVLNDIKIEDEKDDLLEKALHKTRKIKQKEHIIADLIKTEVKMEPEEENGDGGNIVLNATAEFCRTLGDIPTYGKAGNREETEEMIDYEKDMQDMENSDDDCEIIETTGWNSVDPTNQGIDSTQIPPQEVQILDEEPDVSTGVGAALKLAMSKGYLDKEQNNRPSNSRLAHLQAKHYSIEDKAYGDDGDRQNRRERYAGPITDFKEKDHFKPNVKLEYIDDDGHILNSKEAFRYLSHKFHGKGPGKNKVEKRIKKSVQEQLMKKMSSTDTPLGTLNMLQAKQKETQSPFVVLSGSKQAQSTSLSKTRR